MLLCLLTAWAADFNVDGINYKITSTVDLTAEVTKDGDYSGEIIIPATVQFDGKTYSVTSIGESAFQGCRSLTSATIGNSVLNIGAMAFAECSSLTTINIPNSVTSIGWAAFNNSI